MKTRNHAIALALFGTAAWASGRTSPEQIVKDFYRWEIHPTQQEIQDKTYAPVTSLLGKDLLRALETQRAYESACARLVPPDIKPYMLDQSPFFLGPDEPTALESVTLSIQGDQAKVSAHLADDHVRWTDDIVLRMERDRWVIVDIQWDGGGSLTRRLMDFAGNRCTP